MSDEVTRVQYRIRFPAKVGTGEEWHRSNNGTSEWGDLAKVKAVVTRGIRRGYKGQIRIEFADYEIVRVIERVATTIEIVSKRSA